MWDTQETRRGEKSQEIHVQVEVEDGQGCDTANSGHSQQGPQTAESAQEPMVGSDLCPTAPLNSGLWEGGERGGTGRGAGSQAADPTVTEAERPWNPSTACPIGQWKPSCVQQEPNQGQQVSDASTQGSSVRTSFHS